MIKLRLYGFGSSYRTTRKHIKRLNLSTEHFLTNKNTPINKGKYKDTLDIFLSRCDNNRYIKKRLLKEGLLKNQCYICSLEPEWNGKPLTLQLDHINGIYDDNRLENLRLLCPNCHTQTETFCGRNFRKEKIKKEIDKNWRYRPRINKKK